MLYETPRQSNSDPLADVGIRAYDVGDYPAVIHEHFQRYTEERLARLIQELSEEITKLLGRGNGALDSKKELEAREKIKDFLGTRGECYMFAFCFGWVHQLL